MTDDELKAHADLIASADYKKFNRMGYIGVTAYLRIKELAKDCAERERVEHLLALAWIDGIKDAINSDFS